MTTDAEPQRSGDAERVPVFRCKLCARTRECTSTEPAQDTPNGWPRCCEQPMGLFLPAPHPTAAGSPELDGGRDADSFKHNPGGQRA
jgi:hypothetical protein